MTGRAVAVVAGVVTAVATLLPVAVLAAEPGDTTLCDDRVEIAPASLLTPEQQARVDDTAGALEAAADVQVHTLLVADTAGAGLDAFADAQLDVCQTWQADDGDALPRLLVLAVSLEDRQTGSYYGLEITPELNPERDRIHDRTMAPFLRDGDYAQALVEGLADYQRTLTGTTPATTGRGSDATSTSSDGGAPIWVRALAITGIGLLVLLGLYLPRYIRTRRGRRELLDEARTLHDELNATYYDLQEVWAATSDEVVVLQGRLDSDDPMRAVLVREVDRAERALAAVVEVVASRDEPTEDGDLTVLVRQRDDWQERADLGAAARTAVDRVRDHIIAIDETIATFDADLAAIATRRGEVGQQVDDLADGGQLVDEPRRLLGLADRQLHRADDLDASTAPGAAAELLAAATDLVTDAAATADRHSRLRSSLPGRHRTAAADLAAVRDGGPAAWEVLDEVSRQWARPVWDDLADNRQQFDDDGDRCDVLLEQAGTAIDSANYDAADQLVTTVTATVTSMQFGLEEVHDRQDDVERAVSEWPAAEVRAEEAAARADQYLADHETAAAYDQRLGAARRLLEQARTARAGLDPLTAVERAHRAERSATDVLDEARKDVERRMRQAQEALDDARRHVKKARSYRRTYGFGDDLDGLDTRMAAVALLLQEGRLDDAVRESQVIEAEADDVASALKTEYDASRSHASSSWSSGSSSSFGGGGSSSFGSSGSFGGGGSSGW